MAEVYPEMKIEDVPPTTEPTTEPTTKETPTEPTGEIDWGNANCKDNVDVVDVIAVNKYLLGVGTLTEQGKKNADVNANGEVDSDDGLNILKIALEIISQKDCPIK